MYANANTCKPEHESDCTETICAIQCQRGSLSLAGDMFVQLCGYQLVSGGNAHYCSSHVVLLKHLKSEASEKEIHKQVGQWTVWCHPAAGPTVCDVNKSAAVETGTLLGVLAWAHFYTYILHLHEAAHIWKIVLWLVNTGVLLMDKKTERNFGKWMFLFWFIRNQPFDNFQTKKGK